MKANFLEIHSAADFIGPGAVEVPMYQCEITDFVRRRGAFGQRIRQVPATGHPSRFFEETAIPSPGTAGLWTRATSRLLQWHRRVESGRYR